MGFDAIRAPTASGADPAQAGKEICPSVDQNGPSQQFPYDTLVRDRCDAALGLFPGDPAEFTENGKLMCSGEYRLSITVQDLGDITAAPDTQHLTPEKWSCLEDDELLYYAEFGSRPGAFGGNKVCFDNRDYRDYFMAQPFTALHNCFDINNALSALASPFEECEAKPAYQLRLKFYDHPINEQVNCAAGSGFETNPGCGAPTPDVIDGFGRGWPIREERMYVKVSVREIVGFSILATDSVTVTFYLRGSSDRRGIGISPITAAEP